MLWLALPALALATPPPEAPAPSSVATPKEARALLKKPRGSLSLGWVSGGSLARGVELPFEGKGYAVFPHFRKRATNFGTAELVGLIERVGAKMADRYPGIVLGIGNLSVEEGGQTGGSVSHKSGRDADIGMFALDASGEPHTLRAFVAFDDKLEARGGRLRFDVERNLALVVALVEDTEAPIQWIFVAEWLKQPMMALARDRGLDETLVARLDEVMHMPSDSNPHHHHFHIRVHCSIEDRLHGCLERPPARSWVDTGDAEYAARVDDLLRVLRMDDARWKLRAIEALAEIRAAPAVHELANALDDERRKVRGAALEALKLIADERSIPHLLARLKSSQDPDWSGALFSGVLHIGRERTVGVSMQLLQHPEEVIDPSVAAKALGRLQSRAAKALGKYGRKPAVQALLGLLASPLPKVRSAAHEALRKVTNQPIKGRPKSRSERRQRKLIERWQGFVDNHGDEAWLDWLKSGFEARGYRFDEPHLTRASVDKLIEIIGDRDEVVSHNAVHALSAITGHEVDPTWRSKRNNKRHWLNWWRENGGDPEAPVAP